MQSVVLTLCVTKSNRMRRQTVMSVTRTLQPLEHLLKINQ